MKMNPITEPSMVIETLVGNRPRELDGSSVAERAGAHNSILRRLVRTLLLVTLIGGAVFGMYKMRVDIPMLNTPKIYAYLDTVGARAEEIKGRIVSKYESVAQKPEEEEAHDEEHKITVTSPLPKDVIITQQYVCQIHSRRHIDVCALEEGYLKGIRIQEGQAVKEGDVLFEVMPVLYKARLDAEVAERDLRLLELKYTKSLAAKKGVSDNEVKLFEAKLAQAQAKVDLAQAELNFATVTARFDGIVDRQRQQLGSLVKEGDILTTLSDNSVMWVYFNVPEKQYLEYMAHRKQHEAEDRIELMLANQDKFPHPGKIGAIESQFNNENGNIAFRADFPNPDGLLRHGQTGTILIHRTLKNALVIPQRATFELLDKRYVWVVDKDDVAHQKLITIKHELDDIFVINNGLDVSDKIVLEGVRQVEEKKKLEYEFRKPEEALKNQKFRAE
jgi:membrane fusion protein, multidrug efflux system